MSSKTKLASVAQVLFFVGLLVTVSGCKKTGLVEVENRLPKTVKILERFSETERMDSFFLLKANFSTEKEIQHICHAFNLEFTKQETKTLASEVDGQFAISWFPLASANKTYYFCSVNPNGTLKSNSSGRVENALWVDEQNKVFILQVGAM